MGIINKEKSTICTEYNLQHERILSTHNWGGKIKLIEKMTCESHTISGNIQHKIINADRQEVDSSLELGG